MAHAGTTPSARGCQVLIDRAHAALDKDPARSLELGSRALQHAEVIGEPRVEHAALSTKAQAELRLGLYSDFLETTLRALEVAQLTGEVARIAKNLQDLSTAYRHGFMLDKAVEEARNALAMILPTQDEALIDQAHCFLIEAMLEARQYQDAFRAGEQALQRMAERADDSAKARIWHLLARTLIKQQKYNHALPFLAKAEEIVMGAGTWEERFQLQLDRTKIMLGMARYPEALGSLEQMRSYRTGMLGWGQRSQLLQMEYEVALAQGLHKDALQKLVVIKELSDSLQRAQVDLKLVGLQVLHQLGKKEADLVDLQVMNERHEQTITAQRSGNLYLLAALVAMVILSVFLGFSLRHGRRMVGRLKLKNELVRKQSEEIRSKNLELERQNNRLTEALLSEEQKELMIKEIHHRVKNNLQVVDSLLSIQGEDSDDPQLHRLLKDAQGRIGTMAQVHEHLYRSNEVQPFPLQEHILRLGRMILASYAIHDRVSLQVQTCEPEFGPDTLLPLSLVLNELITNSAKHAFSGSGTGQLVIIVRPAGAGYELIYSDTGNKFWAENEGGRTAHFGLELIRILAQQLNGEARVLKGQGMAFSLTFSPDPKTLRKAS